MISPLDLENGTFLLIDKDLHWSSFDVVKKIKYSLRHYLGIKKIKVGHAGTLDPLATGLMIICTGPYTKRIHEFQDLAKEYLADIRLGATTPSFDLETAPNEIFSSEHITSDIVISTLETFKGKQLQVPPLFSAKRVGGKRAYEFARNGSDMKLEPNEIVIHDICMKQFDNPDLQIAVKCSKGTYIRSLAHDLGQAMQSGAYLSGLRRTAIGNYPVTDAMSIKTFENRMKQM